MVDIAITILLISLSFLIVAAALAIISMIIEMK